VSEGGLFFESCGTISAISGNKGGNPLVNKRICEFWLVIGSKKPVHVGMDVNKPRRNDLVRAVYNLAIHIGKTLGNLKDFISLNKNMPCKRFFPCAINNTTVFQQCFCSFHLPPLFMPRE
jgi:hypothetical protein